MGLPIKRLEPLRVATTTAIRITDCRIHTLPENIRVRSLALAFLDDLYHLPQRMHIEGTFKAIDCHMDTLPAGIKASTFLLHSLKDLRIIEPRPEGVERLAIYLPIDYHFQEKWVVRGMGDAPLPIMSTEIESPDHHLVELGRNQPFPEIILIPPLPPGPPSIVHRWSRLPPVRLPRHDIETDSVCPITLLAVSELKHPVINIGRSSVPAGVSPSIYELEALLEWMKAKNTDPLTREALAELGLRRVLWK